MPTLKRKVHGALTGFLERRMRLESSKIYITDRFELILIPPSKPRPACFTLGTALDRDTGGWMASLLRENIQICVDEKSRKIAKFRSNYERWWLVLIDHVGYGTQEQIQVKHDWDKILVVNPMDPRCGYEL